MSNVAKLARLENALTALEQAAGLRTDYEVVREGEQPKTDAPIVVELVRFKDPRTQQCIPGPVTY